MSTHPSGRPPRPPGRREPQLSAGGVLFRAGSHPPEVCLIAKHQGRVWALPKGRLQPGERTVEAAVREVVEETGHRGEPCGLLCEVRYSFYHRPLQVHYDKQVTYFLLRCVEENARPRDAEADLVAWMPAGLALQRLHYPKDRDVLVQALKQIDLLAEDTTPAPPASSPEPCPSGGRELL